MDKSSDANTNGKKPDTNAEKIEASGNDKKGKTGKETKKIKKGSAIYIYIDPNS